MFFQQISLSQQRAFVFICVVAQIGKSHNLDLYTELAQVSWLTQQAITKVSPSCSLVGGLQHKLFITPLFSGY